MSIPHHDRDGEVTPLDAIEISKDFMFSKLRTFFLRLIWIPTQETRLVSRVKTPRGEIYEKQRLYVGRWNRSRWKVETRFLLLGEKVH